MKAFNNVHLTENGTKYYSRAQQILFSFVPKDGTRITSRELAEKKKKAERWNIDFPRNAVITTMGHLMKNIIVNRERFRIRKSKPRGPHMAEFWLEKL